MLHSALWRRIIAAFALVLLPLLSGCAELEAMLGPDHEVVLQADFSQLDPEQESQTDRAIFVRDSETGIRARLAEADIEVLSLELRDDDRIELVVSGARNDSRINRLVATVGRAEFRIVDRMVDAEDLARGDAPPGSIILPMADGSGSLALRRLGGLTGPRSLEARATRDEETFEPIVMIQLDPDGRHRGFNFAAMNSTFEFAIILDDQIVETVKVTLPFKDDEVRISGGTTSEMAEDLAIVINAEPLPVPFQITYFEAIR